MNFLEFYTKIENRLLDAILSLWATGNLEMQQYLKYILKKEPIISDVVFQNTFPWEPSEKSFENLNYIFKKDFIEALDSVKDKEFQFPKDRIPYKHQIESWDALLNKNKSIAVTSGTGSGKTECFMLPVLQDIHLNCNNQEGINAIFIYPLNALIASQKKRLHAWCSSLEGVHYSLLTGETLERSSSKEILINALPELITRQQIRETPPQILFTNPTMLEYMMVRNSDVPILQKSKGKLRWILLDEAHTLTGSKAAEMAFLIRRIVAAFDVDIKNIRFAITSATVGSGNTSELTKFMSSLCGIPEINIQVISGKRVNNQISDEIIPNLSAEITKDKIIKLRNKIINCSSLTQVEIGKILNVQDKLLQLKAIDFISEHKINDENLLPLRGHFFTRSIGGVYVCTNIDCAIHENNKPSNIIGTFYTISSKKCSCGNPLLELISCRSCGVMMLKGKREKFNNGKEKISQVVGIGYEAFTFDSEDSQSDLIKDDNENDVFLIKTNQNLKHGFLTEVSITKDNFIQHGNDYLLIEDLKCPCCGNFINPIHFRISATFANRLLSDIILEQSQSAEKVSSKTLLKGKKYISFTDSRQGTAKIAALINFDSEYDWIRYQVYHFLIKRKNSLLIDNLFYKASIDELEYMEKDLLSDLNNKPAFYRSKLNKEIDEVRYWLKIKNGEAKFDSSVSWKEIIDFLKEQNALEVLFKNISSYSEFKDQKESYIKALLFDQFARKLPRERSLENIGLISLKYPKIYESDLPSVAIELNITKAEWHCLLKISADYVLRYYFHFQIDDSIKTFASKKYFSIPIYANDSEIKDVKKWGIFKPNLLRQNRLVLLICAGLGWHNLEDMDETKVYLLNTLLNKIWETLREKLLTAQDEGYKLDLIEKSAFDLAGKVTLCPITNRLLDNTFRNYSPLIKGNLNAENIKRFKINNPVTYEFPIFPYPFHVNENNTSLEKFKIEEWLNNNSKDARDKAIWNNLHERIFSPNKLYLAGEHSAQQEKERLKDLEYKFEKGELNILSCSTTMEMGVDIGGISAVVMSNVPPMPANYLQRAGRAGRRKENKSLALTFCTPNPIGLRTMNEPKWALDHPILSPKIAFDSKTIVVRQVNSLLLGLFIRSGFNQNSGLSISENIEKFFFSDQTTIAQKFLDWLELVSSNNDYLLIDKQIKNLNNGTPLESSNPKSLILLVLDNFKKVVNKTTRQKENYDIDLNMLTKKFGNNSPAFKAVNARKNQFLTKFVISYLAEVNFIPNAGLPTGVVEFEKLTMKDIKNKTRPKSNPSYPISRALTEFAPGNNILIDGLNYESKGIILNTIWGEGSERTIIQGCQYCGYQRSVEQGEIDNNCPKCASINSFSGLNLGEVSKYTELIEPVGFAIDLYSTPTRLISEKSTPQYLEPLLLNVEPWQIEQSNFIDFRTSSDQIESQILFYNTGGGKGYYLCLGCGRTEIDIKKLNGHRRLRGGKSDEGKSLCEGNKILDKIILGSRFLTDFTEIRLKINDNSFINDKKLIYTLGIIFTKTLAEILAIEEAELDFGIKKYNNYQTIFIYDTAKGGAGYSSQFRLHAEQILLQSLYFLDNCECKSLGCTRCLIDKNTQWNIEDIDRLISIEWLISALKIDIPLDLGILGENVSKSYGSLLDEIKKLNYHFTVKSINIHINNIINDWEIDYIQWLEDLRRERIEVNLIIEGGVSYSLNQEKITIFKLLYNYKIKLGNNISIESYKIHLSVILNNDKSYSFFSKADFFPLTSNWSKETNESFYKVEDFNLGKYDDLIQPSFNSSNLYEYKINSIAHNYLSNKLAYEVTKLNNFMDLLNMVKEKSYIIEYYDKYNKSEFSIRLLLQFIDELRTILKIKIINFNIYLSEYDFKEDKQPYKIDDFFGSIDDYEEKLELISNNYNFEINLIKINRLPHYRYFNFKSGKILSFEMRIDGGIAHGLCPKESTKSNSLNEGNAPFFIRKYATHDLIYNISILN